MLLERHPLALQCPPGEITPYQYLPTSDPVQPLLLGWTPGQQYAGLHRQLDFVQDMSGMGWGGSGGEGSLIRFLQNLRAL